MHLKMHYVYNYDHYKVRNPSVIEGVISNII